MTFKPADPRVLMYIVEKGYIALDGTSLTITAVDESTFSVMLIAYTQARTVVAMKHVGDKVNVEVDLLGKIVEKKSRSPPRESGWTRELNRENRCSSFEQIAAPVGTSTLNSFDNV